MWKLYDLRKSFVKETGKLKQKEEITGVYFILLTYSIIRTSMSYYGVCGFLQNL